MCNFYNKSININNNMNNKKPGHKLHLFHLFLQTRYHVKFHFLVSNVKN